MSVYTQSENENESLRSICSLNMQQEQRTFHDISVRFLIFKNPQTHQAGILQMIHKLTCLTHQQHSHL